MDICVHNPAPFSRFCRLPQNPLSIRSTACQPSGIPRRNTVHTSKPSGEDALDARRGFLEGWLDARRKEALKTLNEAELPAEPEAFEILSVDDKTIDQAVIREVMAVRGFRVTPAFSGIQALNILEKRDKEGGDFPHLILMDTMMPNMTWAETTKIIRKTYGFGIPIILMSNANDEAHITKLVQEGCNDFLVKPFKAAELLARVGLQTRLLQIAAQQLESDKHEALLREILPVSVIERLKGGQQVIADELDEVTVVFSDIVGFTDLTSKVTTTAVIGMLDSLFTQLDGLTDKHGVYKVETIGEQHCGEACCS